MQYKRFDNKIVLRVDIGEDISEQVMTVAKEENITLASISGIGAVDGLTVGVFDLKCGKYDEISLTGNNYEITSLNGNITTMNDKPYVHLHITCAGSDGRIIGGHLFKSKVSITGEIFIDILNGKAERKHQESPNFNRMEL